MAQITSLLNGENINQDHQITALHHAILHAGVIEGLAVTTGQVATGKAFVECTRENGEKIMVLFENTETFHIETWPSKHVYIEIETAAIENGAINAENGTGIGSIKSAVWLPRKNYLELSVSNAGHNITDKRSMIALKSLERRGFSGDGILAVESGKEVIKSNIPTSWNTEIERKIRSVNDEDSIKIQKPTREHFGNGWTAAVYIPDRTVQLWITNSLYHVYNDNTRYGGGISDYISINWQTTIDLGAEYNIKAIIYQYVQSQSGDLEISTDRIDWTNIGNKISTRNDHDFYRFTFKNEWTYNYATKTATPNRSMKARYVRHNSYSWQVFAVLVELAGDGYFISRPLTLKDKKINPKFHGVDTFLKNKSINTDVNEPILIPWVQKSIDGVDNGRYSVSENGTLNADDNGKYRVLNNKIFTI